jgi:hypothetical protein
MDNAQFAAQLRQWADLYEKHPELPRGYGVIIYATGKEEVKKTITLIGGKWSKSISGSEDYQSVNFTHVQTGLVCNVSRDRVCRKIVSYDCDPIMSPEEEAELLTEPAATETL